LSFGAISFSFLGGAGPDLKQASRSPPCLEANAELAGAHSAELLLGRMLAKIDDLCAECDRLRKEQGAAR
jgi:hypothetical protein